MWLSDEHRELISQLVGVDTPETPCLECNPEVTGTEVTHENGCSIAADIEEVCGSDRDWFDAHPAADFFYRDISWGEAADLVATSVVKLPAGSHPLSTAGRVRVERLLEGARVRRFDGVYFVMGPSEFE